MIAAFNWGMAWLSFGAMMVGIVALSGLIALVTWLEDIASGLGGLLIFLLLAAAIFVVTGYSA